jgi:hypothetical protein
MLVSYLAYFTTLKMGAIFSSKTSVDFQRTILHYIPENGPLFKVDMFLPCHISDSHFAHNSQTAMAHIASRRGSSEQAVFLLLICSPPCRATGQSTTIAKYETLVYIKPVFQLL